ncbi:hypothetical protein SAMN02745119_01185 [Trichlorobacter thiogenes]|uniref:Lipoprotein n=1 Tax=Trichlorobacter thiogenes TaxID=115783 RepID=A0A1T4M634_9BACT|nr:hypothetical protein [Trichlorobacter thiogenes]SJZ62459.1 hypothetical protein SAMN02745119_01185 [Trichlorobacter thiogenes]
MLRKSGLFVVFTLLTGCAGVPIQKAETLDYDKTCTPNFVVTGAPATGKTLKSHRYFKGKTKQAAFDNLLSSIASKGYQIINANKELGIISASQAVINGRGATVPLNVMVKSTGPSVIRVDLTFSLTGGLVASSNDAAIEFCKIYQSI